MSTSLIQPAVPLPLQMSTPQKMLSRLRSARFATPGMMDGKAQGPRFSPSDTLPGISIYMTPDGAKVWQSDQYDGKTEKKLWRKIRVFTQSRRWAKEAQRSIEWDPSQQDFGRIMAFWGQDVVNEGRFRVVVRGLDQLEKGGIYLFAPTHNSSIEIPLLFMVLEEWMPGWFSHSRYESGFWNLLLGLGDMCRVANKPEEDIWRFIFVDPKDEDSKELAVKKALKTLQRPGNIYSLIDAPQGTRAIAQVDEAGNIIDGDLFAKGPLNSGVAVLLRRLERRGVKLVPITINGAGAAFPKRDKWWKSLFSPATTGGEIEIILGRPADADEICGEMPYKERTQEIMNYIEDFYRAHYKAPLSPKLLQSP